MQQPPTVEQDRPERDIAPGAADMAQPLAGPNSKYSAAAPEKFLGVPPARQRKRTAGENVFDITTYGGVALLANELLAIFITSQGKEGKMLHGVYRTLEKGFQALPGLNKLDYIRHRAAYIALATVSGNLLVAPVKWLEDRKGTLVRYFDRVWHGKDAESDPDIVAAHAAMDKAPHQSWESLWKGRAITLVSALAVDAGVGHIGAVSTRLLPKDAWYSSFDRIGNNAARKLMNIFDKENAQARLLARDPAQPMRIVAQEGKWVGHLATGINLLTLSASLTGLFYLSSKAFARGKEARLERRAHATATLQHGQAAGQTPSNQPQAAAETTDAAKIADAPLPRVATVEHMARLEPTQTVQVGG